MSASRKEPENLLMPVSCPACSDRLRLEGEDRIALCLACRKAYYLDRNLRSYDLEYLVPRVPASPDRVYAPFWKVEGAYSFTGTPRQQRRFAGVKPLGALYFPAFWMPRFRYFDDFTLRYALLEAPIPVEAGQDPVPGGVRDPDILGEMARLTVLGHLDRIEDVGGVKLDYAVRRVSLAAVPFFRQGDSWVDGICGIKVPLHLFAG